MVEFVVKEYAHVLQDLQVDKYNAVKTILGVKLIYLFIYSKLKQTLKQYRSQITSVHIPNTDRCFLLSLYLVFKLRLTLCVLCVSADYVACKWRYPPFVTLILNKGVFNDTMFTYVLYRFSVRLQLLTVAVTDDDDRCYNFTDYSYELSLKIDL